MLPHTQSDTPLCTYSLESQAGRGADDRLRSSHTEIRYFCTIQTPEYVMIICYIHTTIQQTMESQDGKEPRGGK